MNVDPVVRLGHTVGMDGTSRVMAQPLPARPYERRDWLALGAVAAFAVVALALTAGGYDASDDRSYLEAADAWLAHPPFLGENHWHVRYPLVLAQALAMAVFGRTEAAFLLPAELSYATVVLLSFVLLRRVAGTGAGLVCGLLAAATPVIAIYGKVSFPDEPEAALSLLSLFLFLRGVERGSPACLLGAGLALGTAWVDRISASSLLFLYAVLFLAGWGMARARYLWVGAGAAVPVVLMFGFVTVMTGSPLWRLQVDEHSLEIPSAHMRGGVAGGLRPPFSWRLMEKWVPNSPIDVHWAVNPFIDLAINPQHGAMVIGGAVLGWTLLRRYGRESALGQFLRVLLVWAALILFTNLVFLNLRPMPRYFVTLTWIGVAVVSVWLRDGLAGRWRVPLAAGLAGLLALDVTAASLRPDDIFAERELVRFLTSHPKAAPVYAPAGVLAKAELLLHAAGLGGRVRALPDGGAPPGSAVFAEAARAQPDWPVVWRGEAEAPALLRLLPAPVGRRLRPAEAPVVVQRVPG